MTGAELRPWSIATPHPTCVLTAGCPPERAIAALVEAVQGHRGFRLTSASAVCVEATAGHRLLAWMSPLQGVWPWGTYGKLHALAGPEVTGASVRVRYPIGASDAGAAHHVAAVLEDMVNRLVSSGIQVEVGAWQAGTGPR